MVTCLSNFTYGPFGSRRLGLSLGVNVLHEGFRRKRCTFSCVYCEIGRTTATELTGPTHVVEVPPAGFEEELERVLSNLRCVESVTFGYNGEPSLNPHLGEFASIARGVRARLDLPVRPQLTVFTNASTVTVPRVRAVLGQFDLVLAKLDAGTQADFERVNRPHPAVPPLDEIVAGLARLRSEMPPGHRLALQSLFFRSTRSTRSSGGPERPAVALDAWIRQVRRVAPHEVQVYTIARSPAEPFARPLPRAALERVQQRLVKILGSTARTEVVVY